MTNAVRCAGHLVTPSTIAQDATPARSGRPAGPRHRPRSAPHPHRSGRRPANIRGPVRQRQKWPTRPSADGPADQDEDADQHRGKRHEGAAGRNFVRAELDCHAHDSRGTEGQDRQDAAGCNAYQNTDADHRRQVVDADHGRPTPWMKPSAKVGAAPLRSASGHGPHSQESEQNRHCDGSPTDENRPFLPGSCSRLASWGAHGSQIGCSVTIRQF